MLHDVGHQDGVDYLVQFPKFDKGVLKSFGEFLVRLEVFFKRVSDSAHRFAVEIRNKE